MGKKGKNEKKCKEYKAENRELKNRLKKLQKIIKGFAYPGQYTISGGVIQRKDRVYNATGERAK